MCFLHYRLLSFFVIGLTRILNVWRTRLFYAFAAVAKQRCCLQKNYITVNAKRQWGGTCLNMAFDRKRCGVPWSGRKAAAKNSGARRELLAGNKSGLAPEEMMG